MSSSRRGFLSNALLSSSVMVLASTSQAHEAQPPTSADIGYCQDMSVHHLQALDMCRRVLGRDTGGIVQAAATEVLENQAMEVGQMRAWLADWGVSTVPPSIVMGWMGANQGAGMPINMMPGYASDEELLELSILSGLARGKRWLELMRAHHVGGIMMANEAQQLASSKKVIKLATFQAEAQTFEVTQYDQLLNGFYASVV